MDRNSVVLKAPEKPCQSLSARRAWIEMSICVFWTAPSRVALRKESVDRNGLCEGVFVLRKSRSPQGERG